MPNSLILLYLNIRGIFVLLCAVKLYCKALIAGTAPFEALLMNGLKRISAIGSYHLCSLIIPVFTIPGSTPHTLKLHSLCSFVVYFAKKGDVLWDIAKKYGTSVEHLLAINDSVSDSIKPGMKILVEETVPLLSVRSVQTLALTEKVPYEVEKIKDDSIYEGRTVVSQKGKEGSAKVLAKVTKVNGIEIDKDVLESETVLEPVRQIEKIGTKKRPPTTGSGTFINPSFGTLSSRYGKRWNRSHNGIDIVGSYNTPIKAADGGVVTFAGWMSGYGNYVVINHENGYETAYGHCASLLVSEGSRVAKGDVIAKMGNTGRSTGTHLHFEVKKDGQFVNPLKYTSY